MLTLGNKNATVHNTTFDFCNVLVNVEMLSNANVEVLSNVVN